MLFIHFKNVGNAWMIRIYVHQNSDRAWNAQKICRIISLHFFFFGFVRAKTTSFENCKFVNCSFVLITVCTSHVTDLYSILFYEFGRCMHGFVLKRNGIRTSLDHSFLLVLLTFFFLSCCCSSISYFSYAYTWCTVCLYGISVFSHPI